MRALTKTIILGAGVIAFLAGAAFVANANLQSTPLDSVATPTTLCKQEIEGAAAVFLAFVLVAQPVEDHLARSESAVARVLRKRLEVPLALKAVAAALLLGGTFVFVLVSTSDVLGGYWGYPQAFYQYPVLGAVYNNTVGLVPYVSQRDKGTQASFFFALAAVGLVALRANRGIGNALKDAVTLFVAPFIVVFELALWNQAPEDMTWHVTDYLWMGGTADGGYRVLDTSGNYIFSNWIVLFVAALLVASRIPWLSLPSKALWKRYSRATAPPPPAGGPGMGPPRGTSRAAEEGGSTGEASSDRDSAQLGPRPFLQASGPGRPASTSSGDSSSPAGRTLSAGCAFEPTTLRFLWPEQAG